MLFNSLKYKIKSRFNCLWIFLPIAFYYGLNMTIANYTFVTNLIQANDFKSEELRAIAVTSYNAINGFVFFADGISHYFVSLIIVLLVGLIYSSDFAFFKNTSFGNYCITRTTFKKYFLSEIFSVFFTPFIFVFVISLLILCFLLLKYSAISPSANFCDSLIGVLVKPYFYSHPLLWSLLIIVNTSCIAGTYSLIGMCVSKFTSNRFLISVSPLAVFIFLTIIPQLFTPQSFIGSILSFIYPVFIFTLFSTNDLDYCKNIPIAVIIHWLILIIPIFLTLLALYQKNKKQYIK